MPLLSPAAPNGLDKARAAGGQLVTDCLHLPPSVGAGFIKLMPIEPGLLVSIHHYCLVEELVVDRLAEEQPECLLFSSASFDPAQSATSQLSTTQLASTPLSFRTVLPAHTLIFIVAVVVEKALLTQWLGSHHATLLGLLADQSPRLVEALLVPEMPAALQVTPHG